MADLSFFRANIRGSGGRIVGSGEKPDRIADTIMPRGNEPANENVFAPGHKFF